MSNYKDIIQFALNEDLRNKGDITTDCLVEDSSVSLFHLIAKEDAVIAGLDVFTMTLKLLDNFINIKTKFKNGSFINAGTVVATVSGNTKHILTGERTALNFVCHLSGIATLTNQVIKKLENTKVILLDTRKTTPGLRYLEKQAVLAGGGKNHRYGLYDMVLIKNNHVSCIGVDKAVEKVREVYGNEYKIEVEVRTFDELNKALKVNPDVIMFDNWDVNKLKEAVKLVPDKIFTEASGLIAMDNIYKYANSGVDSISTSYMIKSARWVDFSLTRQNNEV